jgi:hypothetical protein
VIASLVLSIGGHWAVLQSLAWVGMAVSYSQQEPVADALAKTFDGKHPCRLCKLVREGKTSESKQEAKLDLKKFEGFTQPFFVFYFESLPFLEISCEQTFALHIEAPPTPPPLAA